MKNLKFPKLKKEELQKITGGSIYQGPFYNPNDESDANQGGGGRPTRTCVGTNPSTGTRMDTGSVNCNLCNSIGYTDCRMENT